MNRSKVAVIELDELAAPWAALIGEKGERFLLVRSDADDSQRGEGLREALTARRYAP